jgi:hypothetical protein
MNHALAVVDQKYKKCCLIKDIELKKEIKRSQKNQPDYNDPFLI